LVAETRKCLSLVEKTTAILCFVFCRQMRYSVRLQTGRALVHKQTDQDQADRIAQSLSQWWEDAGIDPVEPVAKPARPAHASAPEPASKPATHHNQSEPAPDRQKLARELAAKAQTLEELTRAVCGFDAGRLSNEATRAVIARGNPKATVMLIGEAPGRDEDMQGKPFVGRSGQFLDKMFAAIGLDESSLYITNGVFWRPKGNRTPTPEETGLCLPFVERHIALIQPKFLISIGGSSTKTMLDTETGITRMRGKWAEYTVKNPDGSHTGTKIPLLPFYHPAFVLRKPATKRECWQDLQSLAERLATL
jgi:DNA polymerase